MNETIFENLPQKMNLISDLFSRVVFRDKEACQDLVKIILGEGYEVTGVTSQYDINVCRTSAWDIHCPSLYWQKLRC